MGAFLLFASSTRAPPSESDDANDNKDDADDGGEVRLGELTTVGGLGSN